MKWSIAWFAVLLGAKGLTTTAQTQGGGRQINPPPGILAPLYTQTPSPADSLAPQYQPSLQSPLAPSLPPYPSLQLPPLRRPTSLIEKLFGVGGLRFNYNASVELSAGVLKSRVDNPSLSELARDRSSFDFDQKIRLNATAKLGTKLDLLLNYNTESTLGAEGKQVRLSFRGDDKDKLKLAELGNVSLNTRNSLIRSSGSIFGLRTQWRFGKLSLETLIGQSRSTERRVQQSGGREQQSFELSALDYDEGRHFFLGNFFRQRYDEALAQLPYINSPVRITKIELWVTNRRAKYEEAKHLLSAAELGEARPQSSAISANPSPLGLAQNGANNLYALLQSDTRYRDLQQGSRLLAERLRSGLDFEREESARRLSPSEYILNERLGYVSLINRLQTGETLSVAYEYTYEGQTYRVGEFASESTEGADKPLFVKLLKGRTTSPTSSYWSYMMRNVYAISGLGRGRLGAEQFKLDIAYRNDAEGRMLGYHSTGSLAGKRYLELVGLDQMTAQQTAGQDGRFDYLEGITIQPEQGWVYLPSVEPFGARLERLGLEEAYRYDALYKQAKEIARQEAERNKYYLRGSYTGQRLGEIQLGRGNLEPGSVVVRAGGQSLTEGVDYSVDYMTRRLQLLSEPLLSGSVPVEVSIEGESAEQEQRRTLLGLDLLYRPSKQLEMGLTAIYQQASSLESKPRYGEHNLSSLELGWRLGWRQELPSLQKLLQKLSLGNKQVPSRLSLDLELAHSQAFATAGAEGHYLDDFDTSRSEIDLSSAQAWSLASVPYDRLPSGGAGGIESGYDRAHLAWFQIDPMFQRESNRLMPSYVRNNPSYLSSHYVREVDQREIYPHRDLEAGSNTSLQTLSLRYYPRERGMYNLGTARLGADGYLLRPEESWAGVMRRLDLSDFEAANVEYLEFWLMDPNIGQSAGRGGDLYFNLGDISEDVLLDGHKAFEHGLPPHESQEGTSASEWGRVPTREMLGNSFELQAIPHQDVGLDGLPSEGEASWPAYARYLRERRAVVTSEPSQGAHSPSADPAGDDFEHYRSPRYDEEQSPILERYKYYNGTEGNSKAGLREQAMIGRIAPDSEDLNQDKVLNEENRYYEYKVSLRPEDLREGYNYIVSSRSVEVDLRDGSRSSVRWYQFRIPLSSYTRAIGGISDMRSMRFARMYLSGFREETDLRFASLKLVRGDWRTYTEPLHPTSLSPTSTASLNLSSVNIEEHADREPVSYVLPPGTSRSRERGSASGRERNEQSLAMQIADLAPEDARAIYRHVQYDLRRYERLELSVHAEALAQSLGTAPEDGELELFLRLGSDFRNNYYEYSLPLSLTPQGRYYSASEAHRAIVWPSTNKVELALAQLSALKRRRNKLLGQGAVRLDEAYEEPSELERTHRLGLVGNPSLGSVHTLMIGVRNRSSSARSAELWLNELRLSEPELDKGWAARAQLGLTLSDWATLHLGGQGATAGFARSEQMSLGNKREDQISINLSGQIQLGQLLPDKLGAKIPLTYSYSREAARPEYSPIDEDIKMSDALANAEGETLTRLEQYGQRERVQKSLSLMGVQLGIRSKKPMPYDPANLTLNFNHSDTHYRSPELNYQRQLSWLLGLQYEYTPAFAPLRPFAKLKGKSQLSNYLRDYALVLWPSKVSLSSTLQRSYEEEQLRQGLDESEASRLPATFSNLFVWYRKMSLQWTPLPQLNLSLQTGTDARIEAPLVQVNRELNPDDYALWQEAVDRSIAELGRPQRYTQEASASYTLPTESFKSWRWLGLSTSYNSSYQWDLGSHNSFTGLSLPNTLSNQRSLELSGLFRLKQLYALSPKLAKLEKRIHATGKRDSTNRLSLGDRLLYSLLMLKDLNLSWRESQMIHLPGYLGEVGAIWGQKSYAGALRPGLGFAFGGGDEHFIEQLAEEGRLSLDTQQALSAVLTRTKVFDLKATLQPIKDLNISLQANYTHTRRTELQYMYAGQPRLYGGDMQMTVVGLRGFFEHSTSEGGYSSRTFGHFLEERRQLAEELSGKARGLGASEENSNNPAVLLTAFRRTYLGEGELSDGAIPSLSSMLPNWTINYSGLGRLKPFSGYFRSISLRHSYRGIYRINSYNSHSSWSPLAGEEALGLVATERSTRLGYMEDIASLSLTESFFPLIGADMTMLNGLTLSNQWRRSRSLTLSLGSARLIESLSNEWNVSLSYRLSDISRLWKPKPKLSTPASPKNSLVEKTSAPTPTTKSNKKSVARGLTLKADYSYRYTHNLIRSLARSLSEATLSTRDQRWTFSADYELSRAFTLRAYYELSRITPLVSSGSFSSLETRYGIALKLNLSH